MNYRQKKKGNWETGHPGNHQPLTLNHEGGLSQSRAQKCLRIVPSTSTCLAN